MPTKLNWPDLLIQDATLDYESLLQDWRWLLDGPFRVIAGTKFGDWFIQRPEGHVELLDAMDGAVRTIASSYDEFERLINTQEKQEEWLLSDLVWMLHEKGHVPGSGQCYAFKIPLALGGEATSENVEIMDLAVWVSICGQMHEQLKDLPPGTKISGFKVVE